MTLSHYQFWSQCISLRCFNSSILTAESDYNVYHLTLQESSPYSHSIYALLGGGFSVFPQVLGAGIEGFIA